MLKKSPVQPDTFLEMVQLWELPSCKYCNPVLFIHLPVQPLFIPPRSHLHRTLLAPIIIGSDIQQMIWQVNTTPLTNDLTGKYNPAAYTTECEPSAEDSALCTSAFSENQLAICRSYLPAGPFIKRCAQVRAWIVMPHFCVGRKMGSLKLQLKLQLQWKLQ